MAQRVGINGLTTTKNIYIRNYSAFCWGAVAVESECSSGGRWDGRIKYFAYQGRMFHGLSPTGVESLTQSNYGAFSFLCTLNMKICWLISVLSKWNSIDQEATGRPIILLERLISLVLVGTVHQMPQARRDERDESAR